VPRDIRFKTIPVPVVEQLEAQLMGALQIIAALVLTDEEAEALCAKGNDHCRPNDHWAERFKRELLSEGFRDDLIAVLNKQYWYTNTHPGFALGPLLEPPPNLRLVGAALRTLEGWFQKYAEGEGEDVPEDFMAHWTGRLLGEGFSQEVAEWAMKYGATLACEAAIERLMRPVRAKQAAESQD